jgi:hypothetical protein
LSDPQQLAKRWPDSLAAPVEAHALKQAPHMASNPRVQIERLRIGLARKRELRFHPLAFGNQDSRTPNDRRLGGRGIRLVGQMLRQNVLAAANPQIATVNASQQLAAIRERRLLAFCARFGRSRTRLPQPWSSNWDR